MTRASAGLAVALLLVAVLPVRAPSQTADPAPAVSPTVPAAPRAPSPFVETVVALDGPGMRFALRDMDGDGRRDLLRIGPFGIRVRRLLADGTFEPAEREGNQLAWPGERVAWDLADLDGDGADEVVLLLDGDSVQRHRVGPDGRFTEAEVVLSGAKGYLPAGIRHVRFARDVDDDGRADLVVVGTDRYLIHLARPGEDGDSADTVPAYRTKAVTVTFQPDIELELGDPGSLRDRFGQEVRVPWFRLQDVDGDGARDLVSITDERMDVYLAAPTLPDTPDWSLPIAELEAEADDGGSIVDLDNLLSFVEKEINWRLADLDGEPPNDLVVQLGGRFRIYKNGAHGPDFARPDQVLKASGNVFYFQLRDVDGDGAVDLQLVRADRLSLGRVLRWLLLSGSLDFDIFTYGNEGGTFSRKPIDRKTITVEIPALIAFAGEAEELEEKWERRLNVPARRVALDGDGQLDDVVDIRENQLVFHRDMVPDDLRGQLFDEVRDIADIDAVVEEFVLADLDELDQGATRTIDLTELDDVIKTPAWSMRQATAGTPPTLTHPIAVAPREGMEFLTDMELRIEDLDDDGRSDVIVIGVGEDGKQAVQILVHRP